MRKFLICCAFLVPFLFACAESPTDPMVPPVAYTCGEWGEQCDSDIEITSISGTTFDGDRVNMTIVASVPLSSGNVTHVRRPVTPNPRR